MSRLVDAMKRAREAGTSGLDVGVSGELAANSGLEFRDPFNLDGVAGAAKRAPASADFAAARTVDGLHLPSAIAAPVNRYMAGLVQRLFLSAERAEDAVRSVMFARAEGDSGSASLSVSCAEILLNYVSGRVCLVDANFRAPSLHQYYKVGNELGLAEVLSGTASLVNSVSRLTQGDQSSLWLLPAGLSWDAAGSLLTAEPSRQRFQDVLRSFDYVVIEAPAVSEQSASSILGNQVDGVVLVVEANVTRRYIAQAAAETLRASGARVIGTVLNNRTFPVPDAIYRRL
jgi:protein-tyrosine kinase